MLYWYSNLQQPLYIINKYNQNGNARAVPGHKQKQPLADYVHTLDLVIAYERKKYQHEINALYDAYCCKDILTSITTGCLSKQASENSRPNNEVLLLSEMLRGQ